MFTQIDVMVLQLFLIDKINFNEIKLKQGE